MKITIDAREKGRIDSAKKYYESQNLEVQVEELPIGDYIFTDGNESVAFEFKTTADFVASIQDGRVFNQAINMAEEYNHAFVIIQGDDHSRAKALAMSRNYHEITYFGYLGAIASLNRFVTVIESYSPFINEAYYRMLINAKKSLSTKPIVKKFPKKDKNPAMNYLCYCIYGLNHKRAHDIVTTLNLHSKKDLDNLTKEDLKKINGIGDKLADNILNSIQNE
jgi:ERCC4-type nuclease